MLQTIRNFPPEMMPSMAVDVARQPPGAAVARRQDGGLGTRGRRADADVRRDVRGAQALRQRRAGVSASGIAER
jgi:hypothetical protein